MPDIALKTSHSYDFKVNGRVLKFTRGAVVDVPEGIYHDLIRTGYFGDPHRRCDPIRPGQLRALPRGSEVPIFRDVGLGDVLMAAIPLRELQARHPELRLVYGVHSHFVPLFEGSRFVRGGVRAIPSFVGDFPHVIDLRGYVERQMISFKVDRVDVFSRYLLGGPPSTYRSVLNPPARWREEGREIGGFSGRRPVVGYVPRASQKIRNWRAPYHRRFVDVATGAGWTCAILDRGEPRVSLGEGPLVRDLRGRMSVEDLAKVVSACDVVATPDTGTLHLAEALGVRWAAYFTTVPPQLRLSHYRWGRVLYPEGRLPCLGCTHSPRCSERDPTACAALSTPEQLWAEVEFVHEHDPPWNPYAWQDGGPPPRPRAAPEAEEAEEVSIG